MRSAAMASVLLLALAAAGCTSSGATSPAGAGSSDTGSMAGASAAASLAGASAGDGGAAAGALPEACSLLSVDEITGVVGRAVAAGIADGTDGCKWEKVDPHDISVGLHLLSLPGTLTCQIGAKTPIDGLGDQAGWSYITAADTGSVVACVGRLQVQVVMIGDLVTHTTTEAGLRDNAIALTKLVLGRV
jgi:hypothetical protein